MVVTWRKRYAEGGLAATLTPPPPELGVTRWSSRLLAKHVGGVSHMTVARAWRELGVQPWRVKTFKFSTDPELEAKSGTSSGCTGDPPTNAVA